MTAPRRPPDFATLVRDFFCDRLVNQQNVSPHTVAAYRDTFRLLLAFVRRHHRTTPDAMALAHVDAPTVLAFLDDLEAGRGNAVRTRNARLAAIRAFVTYASSRDPTALPLTRRVLAIPAKRFDRPILGYLTRAEMEAVLRAPDRSDWSGRRDRALFTLMYNTGARVSEAIGLRLNHVRLGPSSAVQIHGKGGRNGACRCGRRRPRCWPRGSRRSVPIPDRPCSRTDSVARCPGLGWKTDWAEPSRKRRPGARR